MYVFDVFFKRQFEKMHGADDEFLVMCFFVVEGWEGSKKEVGRVQKRGKRGPKKRFKGPKNRKGSKQKLGSKNRVQKNMMPPKKPLRWNRRAGRDHEARDRGTTRPSSGGDVRDVMFSLGLEEKTWGVFFG